MEMWSDDQMRSIHKMLNPRSIAVVGASPKGGYGGRLLTAVLKAKDRVRIYPVNPNYDEIADTKCYRSIAELPEAPDLVGIVVPYDKVLPVMKECAAKKAGSAIVISAGFAERGIAARLDLQKEVGAYAKESGLRITGPNCLGLANVRDDIWATASSRTLGGLTGHIALVCQSGATAFGPFLLRAVDAGIGLSHIISTGNETDLDEIHQVCDIISSVDPATPLFLQPLSGTSGSIDISVAHLLRLQEAASARLEDVRVIPQMHLMLGAL